MKQYGALAVKTARKLASVTKALFILGEMLLAKYIKQDSIYKWNLVEISANGTDKTLFFNPSIVQKLNKRYCTLRQYEDFEKLSGYARNYFGTLDDRNKVIDGDWLNDDLLRVEVPGFERLEDLRLFFSDNLLYASAVILTKSNDQRINVNQAVLKIEHGKIIGINIFQTQHRMEKNWVYMESENGVAKFLYSLIPFQIVDLNLPTVGMKVSKLNTIAPSLAVRNSTNLIKKQRSWLCLAHGILDVWFKKIYIHYFVEITVEGIKISNPFVFQKFSDEFALSINENNSRVEVAFGNHRLGAFVGFQNHTCFGDSRHEMIKAIENESI